MCNRNRVIGHGSKVPAVFPEGHLGRQDSGTHEFVANYSLSGSTISEVWRCRAINSPSASTASISVNTSGGL